MIKEYQPINSFTRSPVAAQIIAYFVFIGQALTFFICMYVNYKSTGKQIAILTSYILTVTLQIIITLRTSCIDPSDDTMIEYRNDTKNRYPMPHIPRRNMNVEDCLYCDICTSYVKDTSRHCKVCQRCVEDFDHHCMWINNCVGSKNYKDFMAMIVITLLNMVVYVIGMILLWAEDQWRNYVGQMAAVWAFSAVVAVFCILLMNLVGLHIYLICKGITTYQFIMLQREEEKKKKLQAERIKELEEHAKSRQLTNFPINHNHRSSHHKHQAQNESRQAAALGQITNQEFKTENNFKSNENSDVIFGNNELSHESKTQKSEHEEESTKEKKNIRLTIEENQQQQDNENDDPSPLNSKRESEVNISQFFTKNKSLKFFIGDQIGSRPKSSKNHKRSIYHSVKVNSKQVNKNQSMYTSELRKENTNDFPDSKSSVSLKTIKGKN